MNNSDTEANTKAIELAAELRDGQIFQRRGARGRRYDRSMERYEHASVKTYTSLAVSTPGRRSSSPPGLTATMLMCAIGVRSGNNTVGDFVMINAMMIQLYQPLNFMGMVYREIKQAIIDIEKMFGVLSRNPEIKDVPGAMPLIVTSGNVRFDDVRFSYDPRASNPERSQFRGARPARQLRLSGRPAPANRPFRGCCFASMTCPAARS